MKSSKYGEVFNHRKKNRRKVIKVIVQSIILVMLVVIFIRAVFIVSKYEQLSSDEMTNMKGYIALSYFGVDRSGSAKYISKDELNKQLTLLKEQGFETVSQQQLIDFHTKKGSLPNKALFLSFEDGRNDSSIFAQKTLEQLNYKATMFTYADKMDSKDSKFLKPNHLRAMIKSNYWELGSNGYRLSYINVFNGKGQYIGEIADDDVADKTLIEYYNHYLMDYLRNEYMIPKETRKMAQARIEQDYQFMAEIYGTHFDNMPHAYAIMHANSLYNNMNDSIEQINDKQIKEKFSLHFNRDLTSYNKRTDDRYNLNRLQVAPHWPVNHLLMKIKQDANIPMTYTAGENHIANLWQVKNGVGEFNEHDIILTSEPEKEVYATLNKRLPKSFTADFHLTGSVLGNQSIYLTSETGEETLQIQLTKNNLIVQEQVEDKLYAIIDKQLSDIKWSGEDFAFSKATQYDYYDTQQGSRIVEDEYPLTLNNDRKFTLHLIGDILTIIVDNKQIAKIKMSFTSPTYKFALGGNIVTTETSHEQYRDTIYDSIIEDLSIRTENNIVYDTTSRKSTFSRSLSNKISKILDFFIDFF